MTKGSGLYLAGPSLVKAAIGQVVDAEELGGAQMHAEISGTVDFFEKDDSSCLKRLRSLVALLPEAETATKARPGRSGLAVSAPKPANDPNAVYDLINFDGQRNYDARDLLATIIDENSMDEYKADYGKTIVTVYARINGLPVGIVANQHLQVRTKKEGIQMGGVIYSDSADKAARFVMDCNQTSLPIIFFQDVTGFMVGRDAEQSGIIRSGAKLVNAARVERMMGTSKRSVITVTPERESPARNRPEMKSRELYMQNGCSPSAFRITSAAVRRGVSGAKP